MTLIPKGLLPGIALRPLPQRVLTAPSPDLVPDSSISSIFPLPSPQESKGSLLWAHPDGGAIGKSGGKREGLKASTDRPPPPSDRGLIGRDAARWYAQNNRSLEDAALVERLAERIREELWRTLTSREITPLARKIAEAGEVVVVVRSRDGSLENYEVRLLESRLVRLEPTQVQWTLDLKEGKLTPIDDVGHAAVELRLLNRRIDFRRAFAPFYRRIQFDSLALKADPLMLSVPQERHAALMKDPTILPLAASWTEPSLDTRLREMIENLPPRSEVGEGPTPLRNHFQFFQDVVLQDVDGFCSAEPDLRKEGADFLRRLIRDLLDELYRLEGEKPEVSRFAFLHVWLRRTPEDPVYGRVEVRHSTEMLKTSPGERDILMLLCRDSKRGEVEYPFLEHFYLRTEWVEGVERPTGADLDFQNALGLAPERRLHIRLNALDPSYSFNK